MNKKGFTLVELLAVIAIIAILSIIVAPNIMNINKNINERSYENKKEELEKAAELYGSNNPDLFNGTNIVSVYVYDLINNNYFKVDKDNGSGNCKSVNEEKSEKGCVINPTNNTSMNNDFIVLTKEGAGFSTKYVAEGGSSGTESSSATTLVDAVCNAFASENGKGYDSSGNIVDCYCTKDSNNNYTGLTNGVNACLFNGTNPNNYLKYGDSKANWRVLGVYLIDGKLTAKMITNDPI